MDIAMRIALEYGPSDAGFFADGKNTIVTVTIPHHIVWTEDFLKIENMRYYEHVISILLSRSQETKYPKQIPNLTH
jgi:hypothetical protein